MTQAISVLFDPNIPMTEVIQALDRAGIVVQETFQRDVYVARRDEPIDPRPALRPQAG